MSMESNSFPTVWCVYGTRPEVVKVAPVVRSLTDIGVEVAKVFVGQHRELATDLFHVLEMQPDLELDLMESSQAVEEFGAKCLTQLGAAIENCDPYLMILQGDTATVLFGALVGFLKSVRVVHIEAGLRSHCRRSPFPEEMIRRVVGQLADVHCAPTRCSGRNLIREGIDPSKVFITGNPVIDSVEWMRSNHRPESVEGLCLKPDEELVVVTMHRRESLARALRQVALGVRDFVERSEGVRVVFPVHPNPAVRRVVFPVLGSCEGVSLIEPLPYHQFLGLLDESTVILTDSGGVQEEGPALGKRVLVAREVTERQEGLESGWTRIIGTERANVCRALEAELDRQRREEDDESLPDQNPFGDGKAGIRIADIVRATLTGQPRETEDWRSVQ